MRTQNLVHRNDKLMEIIMTNLANAARVFFVLATVLGTTVACSTNVPANQQIAAEIEVSPTTSVGN